MRDSQLAEGVTVWFTGLPSAGKTTISNHLAHRLRISGNRVEVLDGDAIRRTLCKDLGFTHRERQENLMRIAFVAELLARNGVVVLVAAISPYRIVRDEIRKNSSGYVEVYVNAPLEVCQQRDVKGLYHKAKTGEIKWLTGIDDVYEPPLAPEIECRTDVESLEESAGKVADYLINRTAIAEARQLSRSANV